MDQDQIVQLLLDAARGVVRDRFGVRSETLWTNLEPETLSPSRPSPRGAGV